MNAPARLRLRPEQYLDWENAQQERHEFVRGEVRAMAGSSLAHAIIAGSLSFQLRLRLAGGPRQPFQERRIAIPNGNWRYGDVVVDCGPRDMKAMAATTPTAVFEVESPSTAFLEETDRLEDYQSVPSITQIVILAQDRARARIFARASDGWTHEDVMGLEGALELQALGFSLPLAAVYEGVDLAAAAAATG